MVWIKNEPAKRLSAEPSLAGTYVSDSGEKIALAKDGTATIKAPKPDWPAVSAVLYIQAKPLQTVTFKVGDGRLTTAENKMGLGKVWKKE
jgi:hypothetical protein